MMQKTIAAAALLSLSGIAAAACRCIARMTRGADVPAVLMA